ncbi:hypothetical protein [Flavobacterium commune]|uniref:Uncharacterized protein n=1 Tax=Flavobacterium commune TaxID=1306519 RepID=A0A1D9PAL0_9FLAO|nr:hypothetical protein [Flavobacterium commune]AOZ99606.1 hypothetical protein BIW12_09220 [Flavobacterium commune]
MAKVLMFSRQFPKYHPKAGEVTEFVAKFWANRGIEMLNTELLEDDYINVSKIGYLLNPKGHTIRAGNRFKKGDLFSPRVWSGTPYRSKQIIIAPDTEVLETWDIEIDESKCIMIKNKCLSFQKETKIANNDGLSHEDFEDWFNVLPFKGQIICWNPNINY